MGKLRKPPKEALKKALELLREATLIRAPEPAALTTMLKALAEMGLHDMPQWEGISSSVRQYALAVSSPDRTPDSKFATLDEGLLKHADALEARFGVRPVDLVELMLEQAPPEGQA